MTTTGSKPSDFPARLDLGKKRRLFPKSFIGRPAHNERAVMRLRFPCFDTELQVTRECDRKAEKAEYESEQCQVVRRVRFVWAKDGTVDILPQLYASSSTRPNDDTQMFARFFDSHYPPNLEVWYHITYLRALMDVAPATGGLLELARRTVGLTHLATSTGGDVRVVREARVSYGRLLRMLQFSLAFPPKKRDSEQSRELIAAVALLTHISEVHTADNATDDSWTTHMWAAQRLIAAYASQMSHPGRLDHGLMRHTILNGFLLALAKRKAWNMSMAWLPQNESVGWAKMIAAYRRLPDLLEATDRALADGLTPPLDGIVEALREIQRNAANLYPEAEDPAIISAAAMDSLDAQVEEHIVMASSDTFRDLFVPMTVIAGDGGADALKFVFTAFLSLMVECTILRVWHFYPETVTDSTTQRESEKSAFELARSLCRSALSFTTSDKPVYISIIKLCLTFTRNVFAQQGKLAEIGWCDACLIANRLRAERIRRTSTAPTLCKVEDITSGIVETGRYTEKFDPQAFVIRVESAGSMRLLQ